MLTMLNQGVEDVCAASLYANSVAGKRNFRSAFSALSSAFGSSLFNSYYSAGTSPGMQQVTQVPAMTTAGAWGAAVPTSAQSVLMSAYKKFNAKLCASSGSSPTAVVEAAGLILACFCAVLAIM